MYLTIALTFWFLHYLYELRRKRYTVEIMVDHKFIHTYRTNYLPIIGDIIAVDGHRKAYKVTERIIYKTKDIKEILIVHTKDISQPDDNSTTNTDRTTVSKQMDNRADNGERPKGEVDPNQNR